MWSPLCDVFNETEELKPCPFCGGEAIFECWIGRKGFEASVACLECGALVCEGIYYDSPMEAKIKTIKVWNKRVGKVNE